MKKAVWFWVFWGALCWAPHLAQAAILVVNLRDPATVSSFESLSASQRESELAGVGDIISAKADDWTLEDARFGNKECAKNPPVKGGTLVCVELRGLSSREAQELTVPSYGLNDREEQVMVKYQRFQIDWENLPESVRQEVLQTGTVSLNYEDWKDFVLDKEVVR